MLGDRKQYVIKTVMDLVEVATSLEPAEREQLFTDLRQLVETWPTMAEIDRATIALALAAVGINWVSDDQAKINISLSMDEESEPLHRVTYEKS